MCRVLGDIIHEGVVAKIADDLYCIADPPEELLLNWKRVLQALSKCNLKLSPSFINPKSTMISGWIWDSGTLRASRHPIAALASYSKPETPKVLYCCLLSPDSRYTPVLRLTVTCRHCRRRLPVSRED